MEIDRLLWILNCVFDERYAADVWSCNVDHSVRSVGSFILQDDHQRLYTLLDDAYHIFFRRVASYSNVWTL